MGTIWDKEVEADGPSVQPVRAPSSSGSADGQSGPALVEIFAAVLLTSAVARPILNP